MGRGPAVGAVFSECEECGARRKAGESVRLLFAEPRRHVEPSPPEERFGGLFESARVLLEERAGEDTMLPTLAMEGLIIGGGETGGWSELKRSLRQAWEDADAWEAEKVRCAERPGTATPVEVIRGAVILERVPVVVRIGRQGARIESIVIELTPGEPPEPGEVAKAYKRVLEDAGGASYYHERAVSLDLVFNDYQLRIGVKPAQAHMGFGHEGAFPAPYVLEELYESIKSGPVGSRSVRTRSRGGPMVPDNMAPAAVALFLRIFGGVTWKQVYELVNQHVLRGTWKDKIPEDELDPKHVSRTKQLKNSVETVRRHLVPVMRSLN